MFHVKPREGEKMNVYVLTITNEEFETSVIGCYSTEDKAKADACKWYGDMDLSEWRKYNATTIVADVWAINGVLTITTCALDMPKYVF